MRAARRRVAWIAGVLLIVACSPEETDPEGFARGALRHLRGGVVFWSALALVVVALLMIVARLLPKAEAPK